MQVFCVSFADDYVMHVNLQILKPLGADKIVARDYFHINGNKYIEQSPQKSLFYSNIEMIGI